MGRTVRNTYAHQVNKGVDDVYFWALQGRLYPSHMMSGKTNSPHHTRFFHAQQVLERSTMPAQGVLRLLLVQEKNIYIISIKLAASLFDAPRHRYSIISVALAGDDHFIKASGETKTQMAVGAITLRGVKKVYAALKGVAQQTPPDCRADILLQGTKSEGAIAKRRYLYTRAQWNTAQSSLC